MGAKNNAVRLGLPIAFGSLPFWVFYLLPTLLVFLIKAPPAFLVGLLGGAQSMAELTKITSILSLTFSSCAWVSFAIGTFLFFFVLFFYRGLRKKLKSQNGADSNSKWAQSEDFDDDMDE